MSNIKCLVLLVTVLKEKPMDELPLTDAPPFVFVNGKKYVLADTEDNVLADEPLPERWQNLQPPPRYLPAAIGFYLHSFGTIWPLAFVGWIFTLLGLGLCCNLLLEEQLEPQHLLVAVFPLAGIGCMIGSIYPGHKAFSLLRDGEIGKGYFLDMKPTGMSINEQPVMQLRYRLVTSDGEELETFTKSLNTEHATEVPVTPLLYNPLAPQTSLALDDLPAGIHFDQSAEMFASVFCVAFFRFCVALPLRLNWRCYVMLCSLADLYNDCLALFCIANSMKAGNGTQRNDRIVWRVDPVTAMCSVPGFH